MQITCKIFSNNFLLHLKLENFIRKTPFFVLSNFDTKLEEEQILFWDIDSEKIDGEYIRQLVQKGLVVMLISSLYTPELILNNFRNDEKIRIGFLTKCISYTDFVSEISRMIEANLLDS